MNLLSSDMTSSCTHYVRLSEAAPDSVQSELEAALGAALSQSDEIADRAAVAVAALSSSLSNVLSIVSQGETAVARSMGVIRSELEVAIARFDQSLKAILADGQGSAVLQGQDLIDRPIIAAGVDFGAAQVVVRQLDTLIDFGASLAAAVSSEALEKVLLNVQLVAIGGLASQEALAGINTEVPPSGIGTGLGARAERLTTIETGRVQSFAAQERLRQLADQVPDLRKQWMHSGVSKQPRSGHIAASGTIVGIEERFLIAPTVGGSSEALLFPRDPVASARNSIWCRCGILPFLERWQ